MVRCCGHMSNGTATKSTTPFLPNRDPMRSNCRRSALVHRLLRVVLFSSSMFLVVSFVKQCHHCGACALHVQPDGPHFVHAFFLAFHVCGVLKHNQTLRRVGRCFGTVGHEMRQPWRIVPRVAFAPVNAAHVVCCLNNQRGFVGYACRVIVANHCAGINEVNGTKNNRAPVQSRSAA